MYEAFKIPPLSRCIMKCVLHLACGVITSPHKLNAGPSYTPHIPFNENSGGEALPSVMLKTTTPPFFE